MVIQKLGALVGASRADADGDSMLFAIYRDRYDFPQEIMAWSRYAALALDAGQVEADLDVASPSVLPAGTWYVVGITNRARDVGTDRGTNTWMASVQFTWPATATDPIVWHDANGQFATPNGAAWNLYVRLLPQASAGSDN